MGNNNSSLSCNNKTTKDDDIGIQVDGGYLYPNGLYTSNLDYEKPILKSLILQRKIAPFYKGLQDSLDDAEHTTGGDSIPNNNNNKNVQKDNTNFSSVTKSPSFKDTLTLGGQDKSLLLYKAPIECPICFLYYPRNVNFTRCCDQPICTECFLQIKRSDSNLEPASCPFCVETNFGIIYAGLGTQFYLARYGESSPASFNMSQDANIDKAAALNTTHEKDVLPTEAAPLPPAAIEKNVSDISSSSRPSTIIDENRKRRESLSHTSPHVVTVDDLRPYGLKMQQEAAISRAASANQRSRLAISLASQASRGGNISNELATAAGAAAALVENLADSGLTGSRRRRRGDRDPDNQYLRAMRNMGADLEEIMLMEAMRRSLIDEQQASEAATPTTESVTGEEEEEGGDDPSDGGD